MTFALPINMIRGILLGQGGENGGQNGSSSMRVQGKLLLGVYLVVDGDSGETVLIPELFFNLSDSAGLGLNFQKAIEGMAN